MPVDNPVIPEGMKKIHRELEALAAANAEIRKLGIDVSKSNADGSWQLPMPARYIVDQQQVIRYAAVNADYMVRPDPNETIAALEKLGK